MSAYSRPTTSAPRWPRKPHISLDDLHGKNLFTKSRIQDHLRKAGLLNKDGEILTQAEYDSKQTNVAIGRENRRKIDDAITEVLNDMGREHWAHACKYTEDLRKDVWNQFARIEEEYRRRKHPITIRRGFDGRIQLDPVEPITDNSTGSSTGTFPPVQQANGPHRAQSARPPTIRGPTDLDKIRPEINNIKNKLVNLDKKLNTDWRRNESDGGLQRMKQALADLIEQLNFIQRQQEILNKELKEERQRIDELYCQPKLVDGQAKPSQIDNQPKEHFTEISNVIKELHNRILILETSSRPLPTGLTQEAIDEAIKISEKKTIDRERVIENLVRGTDDKIKQIEAQLAQLLTRLDKLPNSITYADAHQLIQNEILNFKRTLPDNNEWQNLAREAINKVNHLEDKLNQFLRSTKDNITSPAVAELIEPSISIQRSEPQANINFEQHFKDIEQRFKDLERRLNSIPLPPNLSPIEQRLTQLENYPRNTNDNHIATLQDQIKDLFGHLQSLQGHVVELDSKKLERQEIPQILDDIEQKSQQQLQNFHNTIMGHLQTKPDYQTVKSLIKDSEGQTNQQINALQQLIKKNQSALKILEEDLNDLRDRLNQQPTTTISTSKAGDNSKHEEDPVSDKPTPRDLQAIMPFIELLPTFDRLNENEWI